LKHILATITYDNETQIGWRDSKVKFEYLGEDKDFEGAKMYRVEAIHVITTRNKRKFTRTELERAGSSLSFRPLNINHDIDRQLPFPENATLFMEFDPTSMSVKGRFRVLDSAVNAMIETDRIKQVSIEQIPTKGEDCNEISCEQHGVAFIGMALLENGVPPGDPHANIMTESVNATTDGTLDFGTITGATANVNWTVPTVQTESLSSLIISDGQRTCKECTDFEPCHTCKHKVEQGDDCMSMHIKEIKSAHPDWKQDQVIAVALKKCGKSNQSEAWWWYDRAVKSY